ncbi:GTP-binding protein [Actinocrispum sp. NPDC049592]|uniref:ribosome hibernation factor-recruiting GTPase MRF n=1 Tax=Actinocrispum sp. NPDC049592 TaxID=3154835 RepID=UPI00342DE955
MSDGRVPVVLVGGLPRRPVEAVAMRMLRARPGTVVVHHDLRRIRDGVVTRRLRWRGEEDIRQITLVHGCVSCTLREDLLPLLRSLSGRAEVQRIVVHLDPTVTPESVCWAINHILIDGEPVTETYVDGVVTVIDLADWLSQATGDAELAERGFGVAEDDERTLAEVAVRQVEFADSVVLFDSGGDAWTGARTAAVLRRIAPLATMVTFAETDDPMSRVPADARRGREDSWFDPLLRGQPPLESDCGVSLTVFRERRPFHPVRLHAAMDVLLEGVVRARGRFWVASQPDVALWLESAGGGLRVAPGGPWLATVDDWGAVDAERRAKASLEWHPRFGDRAQELTIVSHLAHPDELTEALSGALLTDAELADPAAWARIPDPFGQWHRDPCVDAPVRSVLNEDV